MKTYIDHSVYPDFDNPPEQFDSIEDQAEYLHRVCAAWDFGIHPEQETFDLFKQWLDVFDQFPIVTSPAYHAFRAWFRWERVPIPAGVLAPIPQWVHLDRLEGRPPDPCEKMI